jgi:hypothetical protein
LTGPDPVAGPDAGADDDGAAADSDVTELPPAADEEDPPPPPDDPHAVSTMVRTARAATGSDRIATREVGTA